MQNKNGGKNTAAMWRRFIIITITALWRSFMIITSAALWRSFMIITTAALWRSFMIIATTALWRSFVIITIAALWRCIMIITAILLGIRMRSIKPSPSTATETTSSASTPAPRIAPIAIPTPIHMLSRHKPIPCKIMSCSLATQQPQYKNLVSHQLRCQN
uniref:Uncharacterized protein n=1 Tax=Salix viminalis TaxID=40686 RepID=A0A6N2K343_SALVM